MTRWRDAPYWVHSDPGDNSRNNIPDGFTPPETVETAARRITAELEAACPGECNAKWRTQQRYAAAELHRAHTAGRDPDPDRLTGPLTAHDRAPVWCRACADEIIGLTARLPDVAADVGARRDGHLAPPPPSERRAAAVAPPSPSPAWDQVDVIATFAADWSEQLAQHLEITARPGRSTTVLTRHVAFLIGHKSALLAAPFAETYGQQVRALVHRSERLGGVDPLVHRLKDPCFVCGRKDLKRPDGAGKVTCGHCGRSWKWELFDFLDRKSVV